MDTHRNKNVWSCDSSYQKVKKAELHCIVISTCRIRFEVKFKIMSHAKS